MVKTARATADFKGKQVQVRIFIDKGSQRSYISQKIAHELGIEPVEYVDLDVRGFHNSVSRDRYGRTNIGIKTSVGIQEIPVLITWEIVGPIDQRGWDKCLSRCISVI
jgi:hypothetical protein